MIKVYSLLFGGLLLITSLAGCSSPASEPTPTLTAQPATETPVPPTYTPAPTHTPVPPTDTPEPTQTPLPTDTETPVILPSETPTETPTVTPTLAATQAGASLPAASRNTVWIYFIQEGTGGDICGDSAVPVGSGVDQKGGIADALKEALKRLFAYKDEYVGGLYNPLSRSNLRVNKVRFNEDDGLMTVDLTGTYKPSGDKCDNSRVKAQIWNTVRQWREVKKTNIYLNGIPFGDRVSNDK